MSTNQNRWTIVIDDDDRSFLLNGKRVELTQFEFIVLRELIRKKGAVATRGELSQALYRRNTTPLKSNVLEVIVSRLRAKLASVGAPDVISTARGTGYSYIGWLT